MTLIKNPIRSSREGFNNFHHENPHVYKLFTRFAFDAIRAGRPRFSARTVIHRIRWYTSIETNDPEGFKINNNWSPYYARMFVGEFPHHSKFFASRKAIADGQPDGQ